MSGTYTYRVAMASEWAGVLVIMWFLSLYYSLLLLTCTQCIFFHSSIFSLSVWFCLRWSLGSRIQLDFLENKSNHLSLGVGEFKPIYSCSNYWQISMYCYFAFVCFSKIIFPLSCFFLTLLPNEY